VASAGDQIENPITGERVVFRRTATETDGELLEFDWYLTQYYRSPPHVHPAMEERFEVVTGRAYLQIVDEERKLAAGEVVTVPPGTPHSGGSLTRADVHLRIELRPALREEQLLERLFALAREGRTDDPRLLAQLVSEFRRETVPAPRRPA
jgi:quercetin dioxygenase-like cupin family protein